MTNRELRFLTRTNLVEIIYELQQSEAQLQSENDDLKRQLEDRRVSMAKAGTLAEVSALINGVFESTQMTADQYLLEIERNYKQSEEVLLMAKRKADELVKNAERECAELKRNTRNECRRLKAIAMGIPPENIPKKERN